MNSSKESATLHASGRIEQLRAIAARRGEAPFPNLFIIGAQKSGTTSLHTALRSHPDVFMCEPKEPAFFIPARARASHIYGVNSTEEECLRIYLKLFRDRKAARYAGEASTHYTMRPMFDSSAELIYAAAPEARIVYLMRDPVERTISHYWWNCHRYGETRLPMQAILGNPQYCGVSYYAMQLHPYVRRFSLNNIFALTTEEYASRPEAVLRRLFDWLGLDPGMARATSGRRENVTPDVIYQQRFPISSLLWGSRVGASVDARIPHRLRGMAIALCHLALRPIGRRVVRSQVDLSELIDYLRSVQREQVEELSDLLHRDFNEWRTLHCVGPRPQHHQSRSALPQSTNHKVRDDKAA